MHEIVSQDSSGPESSNRNETQIRQQKRLCF